MEWVVLAKAVLALIFVVSLIALMGFVGKKYKLAERLQGMNRGQGRLKIKESIMLDARRKLMIISRDEVEHLVLLSPESAVVVEAGIRVQNAGVRGADEI